jgi:transcription antitermination factor NusG
MTIEPGDRGRVIAGPCTGWEGEVLGVERERVIVVIAAFARSTAIDVRPSEVEPIRLRAHWSATRRTQ